MSTSVKRLGLALAVSVALATVAIAQIVITPPTQGTQAVISTATVDAPLSGDGSSGSHLGVALDSDTLVVSSNSLRVTSVKVASLACPSMQTATVTVTVDSAGLFHFAKGSCS